MNEDEIKNLISLEGFTAQFWKEYRETGGTQREVFDRLNAAYHNAFGVYRFPSYDAFRMQRDRKTKK